MGQKLLLKFLTRKVIRIKRSCMDFHCVLFCMHGMHAICFSEYLRNKECIRQYDHNQLILFWDRNGFKHELTLLEKVRHPNVVQFVGAVTQNVPMMIVSEYHPKVSIFFLISPFLHKIFNRTCIIYNSL